MTDPAQGSSTELLPCPFCGAEAKFEREGDFRKSCIVACTECGCRHESGDEDERSGSSWNERHVAPPAEGCAAKDLDCMEFMPLALVPLEKPNHDPGEHQVLDNEGCGVFNILGGRETAERVIKALNAAYDVAQRQSQPESIGLGELVDVISKLGGFNTAADVARHILATFNVTRKPDAPSDGQS